MGTHAIEEFAAEMVEISTKPRAEQAEAMRKAVSALPKAQKDAMYQALIPKPDTKTSNAIWLIIILSFSIVMLLSVVVLSITVYIEPASAGTKPETILTVFMTVTAFLAGLFAPSPVPKKDNS